CGKIRSTKPFKKCKFFKTEMQIFGFIISHRIVKIDLVKGTSNFEHALPANISVLWSFLGLYNVSKEIVRKIAELESPPRDLLKGETKKQKKTDLWTDDLKTAFKI
ncbi:hypothetical protein M153_126710001, partial [Pseudoloma neurophilia]